MQPGPKHTAGLYHAGLFILATLQLGSVPVQAHCTPAAASGAIATCSGTTVGQGTGAPGTSISTAGYGSFGVHNAIVDVLGSATVSGPGNGLELGNNSNITNAGTISGTAGIGVSSTTIANLLNSGTITGQFSGVSATSISNLVNAGNITADNTAVTSSTITSLMNSGVITGGSTGVSGFTINSLVNTGTISTNYGFGVIATNLIDLTNSGEIVGNNFGVLATNLARLTNSGRITGNFNAIFISGTVDTTLTLLPGSNLQGAIFLGGGTNTLNVGNGLSIANTFVTAAPVIGTTNGAPFAVSGTQVAVVDPTNLSMQDELLTGLAGGIFSTVQNRLNGFGNDGISGVTANLRGMGHGGKSLTGAMAEDTSKQGWAQGFGSYRLQREQDGAAVDSAILLGGVVSGFDASTGARGRAGFFFGRSWGEVDADYDSQETDTESVFGGLYGRWLRGKTFIDAALTLGYSDYDRERNVANNLVAGGIETAKADYDGWFVSPEVTLTRPLWAGEQRFEKSVTLRYAGLFLDGFTENGTAAPLTVNSRDIHVLQARSQLTMPNERHGADGSLRRDALYIGLEGRANAGDDDVSGALLGQNITFDPGGDDVAGAAFAGLQFERTAAGGTTLYGSIEGQVETGGGRRASAKAGGKFRF